MTLRQKGYWFTVVGSVLLIVVFSFVTILSFKHFTIDTVREQARLTAEMLRVSITEQMRNGTIEHRNEMFKRMRIIPGLVDMRVLRGEPVIHQFGEGLSSEKPRLDMEKRVLATGKWEESIQTGGETPIYQITIPYIARSTGNVNCLKCHDVQEGAINGAITLGFSLTKLEQAAFYSIVPIVLLLCLFGACLGYFLKRILTPVVETSERLEKVVSSARQGDFSGRITTNSKDEINSIAQQTNLLMQTLDESIGMIAQEVKSLDINRHHHSGEDMLVHTVSIVKELVSAAKFKQMIENDVDLDEIYERIRHVLLDNFGFTRFSFYEITDAGKQLAPIFVEGLEQEDAIWCSPEILASADQCRAKRTADCVSSIEACNICNRFAGTQTGQDDLVHVCIPMLLSGSVGGVLQVVLTEEEAEEIQDIAERISIYLQEAVPVIESRRLMQSLKETTLRDPMTGLYNRRFLEDCVENLTASIERRQTSLGILMIDVDFFKQVNDDYGHDIGDSVLKGVAKILKDGARTSDLVIRYGGEEFIMLLPDADEQGALLAAERIRKAMEDAAFDTPQGPLKKTLSVGIGMFPLNEAGFWQTVKYADVALYQAKKSGRNKVLMFSDDMMDTSGEY